MGIFADYDEPAPDEFVGSWHVDDPALLAIGIHQLLLPLPVAALPRDASVYVWIDHHHDVVETNEQDNIAAFYVGAFQLPDGSIFVWGGNGGDTVTISQSSNVDVTVNGNPFVYIIPPGGIPVIVVSTFGGNDDVDVNGNVNIPIDGDTGSGDDTIGGGSGGDTIDGGSGNDGISGGGGGGGDTIFGGDGDDTIYGWDGNDTIDCGDGNDYANGGAGGDIIVGGLGSDNVNGDIGPDVLTGGYGWIAPWSDGSPDIIDGGSQDDGMWGNGLEGDSFDGGSGNDTINGVGDGGEGLVGVSGGSGSASPVFLSQAELLAFLDEGRRRWLAVGLDAASSNALDDVRLIRHGPAQSLSWTIAARLGRDRCRRGRRRLVRRPVAHRRQRVSHVRIRHRLCCRFGNDAHR